MKNLIANQYLQIKSNTHKEIKTVLVRRRSGQVTWQLACCMGKGTVVVVNGWEGAWGRSSDLAAGMLHGQGYRGGCERFGRGVGPVK